MARDAKAKQEAAQRAHSDADKKLKETIAQLTEVEKARRNTESALKGYKKQVVDALEAQKKVENKMALTAVELKQANKQLETKEKEKAEAEQVAFDTGMTEAAEILTTQLRDVARAFCLDLWGQALNVTGVDTESELWAPDKVYYPPALCLAPTLPQPLVDPSSAPLSSSAQPSDAPSSTSAKGKDKKKELPPPVDVPDVEAEEEAVEVGQLKRQKKEKESKKKGTKEKESATQLSFQTRKYLGKFCNGLYSQCPLFPYFCTTTLILLMEKFEVNTFLFI